MHDYVLQVLVLNLWEAFVKTADFSSLSTVLPQVVANLYPLFVAGLVDRTVSLYRCLFLFYILLVVLLRYCIWVGEQSILLIKCEVARMLSLVITTLPPCPAGTC